MRGGRRLPGVHRLCVARGLNQLRLDGSGGAPTPVSAWRPLGSWWNKALTWSWAAASNEDSAQSTLHRLLSDDAANHSGGYFRQSSVLYRDKECRDGGWPMESPNPNATNMDTAHALVAMTYDMVGLAGR